MKTFPLLLLVLALVFSSAGTPRRNCRRSARMARPTSMRYFSAPSSRRSCQASWPSWRTKIASCTRTPSADGRREAEADDERCDLSHRIDDEAGHVR